MINSTGKLLATTVLATALLHSSAHAFDAQAFVDNMIARAAKNDTTVTYQSLSQDDETSFRLEGLSIQAPDQDNPVLVNSISATGIEELDGNSFAAATFVAEGFSASGTSDEGEDVGVSLRLVEINGLYYPDPELIDAPIMHFDTSSMKMRDLAVTLNGSPLMEIPAGDAENRCDETTKICGSAAQFEGMSIDLSNIDDPAFTAQRKKLGYDHLVMDMKVTGSWDQNSGRVELSEYSFNARDAGRLNLTLAMGGYTEDFIRKLREVSAQLDQAQAGLDDEDSTEEEMAAKRSNQQQLQTMRLMGLMGNLSLESLSLTYDDGSLTGRLLDLQAGQMGATREELAQMYPMMVPMMLAPLENPTFAQGVTSAVTRFLGKPGSISITAKPSQPVPLTEIMGVGMAAPQTLIELLGVTVNAEDCVKTC